MIDDKVTELLEAAKEYRINGGGQRLDDAIAAFDPLKPKRGELWVNEYPNSFGSHSMAREAVAFASIEATRVAVHYREVLPGDENLVLVKPASEWTDKDLEILVKNSGKMLATDWSVARRFMEAVIDAIREKCRVM